MSTKNQTLKSNSKKIIKKLNFMKNKPQRQTVCLLTTWVSPKKPNSARRKVAKAMPVFTGIKEKPVWCYIPGEAHEIKPHGVLMIRGGRTKDVPGLKYKVIRGRFSAYCIPWRKRGRSKFGTKKWMNKGVSVVTKTSRKT
jgi:small subunit ribosomal protein S12